MKILRCDACHAEVNDYGYWYNDEKPRNMYELHCIHESNSYPYEGMIFCQECINKLCCMTENENQKVGKEE